MGEVNGNTILYKTDRSIIELENSRHDKSEAAAGGVSQMTREAIAPELFETEDPADKTADTDSAFDPAESHADSQINQSNYLRYLSELRKADSELALAKAESAELVRLMDSYKEHYCEYEKMIHSLVQNNDEAVSQQLENITSLARKLKKTSSSLDAHIEGEIQRLTQALAASIEGSVKESCDKELEKVSEATQVLYDYSDKVKQQYHKFERLEGVKFGLFILSSISAPIILILMILNLLHII